MAQQKAVLAPAKLKIFISYSRKDREFARRLGAALAARGLLPRIDERDLPALQDWQRELLSLIQESDVVVFKVSPESVASPVFQWEIEQVEALNKRLAPVVVRPAANDKIPPVVARIQYLFFDPPIERQVERLVEALCIDHAWLKWTCAMCHRASPSSW
jgi:TIR domain